MKKSRKESWKKVDIKTIIRKRNQNGSDFVNADCIIKEYHIIITLGYIVKRNFDSQGQYVSYDTIYLTQFTGMEVATTNQVSLSNGKGEINNMIAPVKSMIGDTMRLTADWYMDSANFYIVLD